ncbi:hypothetical protein QUF94_24035 [Peribacillus sp. NJ4]|uniref:hypothetical protein n=1 Tax=Peribacillus sp. NJ4 TaxID=3055862 RepID=UPI0025A0D6FA|nr:hypothetical protein [Peribacillus sp. NJ4]MDM5214458.1 hypothetical protein [Peribacillus sp. NJ4]
MNKFIFGFLVILTTALMGFFIRYRTNWLSVLHPKLLAGFRFILAGFSMVIVVKPIKRPSIIFFPDSWCQGMLLYRIKDHFSRGIVDLDIHEPVIPLAG